VPGAASGPDHTGRADSVDLTGHRLSDVIDVFGCLVGASVLIRPGVLRTRGFHLRECAG
jgi:hypothetical protein